MTKRPETFFLLRARRLPAAAGQGIPKPGADLSIGLTQITGITRHG
jgi:hypothetical protein